MENLKVLRQNARVTQLELAQALSLNRATYNGYEQGISEPNIANLIKLADYFGCSVDYLIGHQTNNTLQLDGLSEDQKTLINIVLKLDAKQTTFAIGYFSDALGLPYSAVQPTRPF